MASVLDYYSATMGMRGYAYVNSDSTGGSTPIEKGEVIHLSADYASTEADNRYHIIFPVNGWLNKSYVQGITPVYKTVTDSCTAPTSVTLNTSTKVLTISGGKGGDQNTFKGYGISWRDKPINGSYGGWASDVVVNSSSTTVTYTVSAPAGYVRQFRVRTLGSAGSSYYSAYVTCGTTLTGNTAPKSPSVVFPVSGGTCYSATPIVKVNCPADPDGDEMALCRKVDSGDWEPLGTVSGDYVLDTLPALSNGSHTIQYKLLDIYGATSATISITVTKLALSWTREIVPGTVISNKEVSHQADISQMLDVLNAQCAWYGKASVTLTGTLGRFGDWKAQMEQMLEAIKANAAAAGKAMEYDAVPSYPAASVINTIRTQLTAF